MATEAPLAYKIKMIQSILLSILPGLAQLVQGQRQSGLALLSATLGMFALLLWDLSTLTLIFVAVGYLSLVYHAAKDALHETRNTESVEYVLGLAVIVGPFALPLLWQNQSISPRAKQIWTGVIVVITVLLIISMKYLDPMMEQMLENALPGTVLR